MYILARIEYPGQVSIHWRYLLVNADVFRRYLGMMAVPTGQTMFHEVGAISSLFQIRALAGIGVVGAFVAAIWWLRRSEWLVSFGLAWFALLLVPSAVLITLNQGEPMTEHRVYVASAGLFLAAGAVVARIVERLSDRDHTGAAGWRGRHGAGAAVVYRGHAAAKRDVAKPCDPVARVGRPGAETSAAAAAARRGAGGRRPARRGH